MGGVATMSDEKMEQRVKAQMQDGDYVQLWQQMSTAPVPDRLAMVKRNFDSTVDWGIFANEWLEMFADESDVNLWGLAERDQICAVINSLKDKQVSCASEPCTQISCASEPAQDLLLTLLPLLQDAVQVAQQQRGKRRSSTRGAYGGRSSQPSSWLKPKPRARGKAILVPKSAADGERATPLQSSLLLT